MTQVVGLIGGRTVTMAAGVCMAGQEFPTTMSGFPEARSSIIPSQIGEARPEGGVIRSRSVGSPGYRQGFSRGNRLPGMTASPQEDIQSD